MSNPIELFLITGFLGAGKTTFIKHILTQTEGRRVGVIVNEFGNAGIDGKLIEKDGLKLAEINNGSIFCACLKADFVRTLAAFLEQPLDMLFVEATGLADPGGMEALLQQLEPYLQRRPELSRRYRWRGSVCLVDAVHFLSFSKVFPPAEQQVRQSRFLVLNKIGDVGEKKRHELLLRLKELNPAAIIFPTDYGKVPLQALEERLRPPRAAADALAPWKRPATYVITMPEVDSLARIKEFCKCISHFTFRIKGFFPYEDGFGHIDCVGNDIRIRKLQGYKTPPDCKLILIGKNQFRIHDELALAWQSIMECPLQIEEK